MLPHCLPSVARDTKVNLRLAAARWLQKVADAQGCFRTKLCLYQSLCLPAGVPSDQSATATKNTRIGGNPFIWDGSCAEENQ